MEEELLKHLTNLVRHSTEIEFKIPSLFFSEKFEKLEASKEVQDAWIFLRRDVDLQLWKETEEEGIITVRVTVIQSKGDNTYGNHCD